MALKLLRGRWPRALESGDTHSLFAQPFCRPASPLHLSGSRGPGRLSGASLRRCSTAQRGSFPSDRNLSSTAGGQENWELPLCREDSGDGVLTSRLHRISGLEGNGPLRKEAWAQMSHSPRSLSWAPPTPRLGPSFSVSPQFLASKLPLTLWVERLLLVVWARPILFALPELSPRISVWVSSEILGQGLGGR